MDEVTLELYKQQERKMAVDEARRGFAIHALVTVLVVAGLTALNVFVASEFPWAIFPAVGMSIGLFMHWYFGIRRGDEVMQHHQDDVEREIRRQAA